MATQAHSVRYTYPSITAVIPTLRAGGAERVLAGLAGSLTDLGHHIRIVTFAPPEEVPFYPLASGVRLEQLGGIAPQSTRAGPASLIGAALRLRRALVHSPPDVIVGFTTVGYMTSVMACAGLDLRIVAAERIDPGAHGRHIGRLRMAIRDLLYRHADHIAVQTMQARRALAFVPDHRISVIPNPVHPAKRNARPEVPNADGRFRLIGVGRLEQQKGFDLLIPAFARLATRFPDWNLDIFGAGPAHDALERLIQVVALKDRITLHGVSRHIGDEIAESHVMAFPSRFEGFPNALAEAMAAGLPVVAYRGVSGVEDLIIANKTGLLANPADPINTLAIELGNLMCNQDLRANLGAEARKHVGRFAPAVQYRRWEDLLRRVASVR